MSENIKLSKYADDLISNYNKTNLQNCDKIITYLNNVIKDDLYVIGKSNNSLKVYDNLIGWLFKFYPNELKKSFEINDFNYDNFKKHMIICFIITFFRNSEKAHILYDSLKENDVVYNFLSYDNEKFELYTKDYGIITFYNIDSFINNNLALLDKLKKMKTSIIDGCHEISEFLIKNDKSLTALTGISTNPLDGKIFHSVVFGGKMIIDIPNGIIMSYDDYFKLNNFQIINKNNYSELKLKDAKYKKYDESKTLYPLLRCMLYDLYVDSNKNDY